MLYLAENLQRLRTVFKSPAHFTQGAIAALMNSIAAGVIGTLLLVAYAATRTKKGSLAKKV